MVVLVLRPRPKTDSQLIDLHGILVPEWRLSNKEFIGEDTKCPPIDSGSMPYKNLDR